MSYDVYFSAANGLSFCIDDLETYFLGRPGYAYEKDEIIYRNDRTQVSFTFEFQNVNLATVGKLRFTLPYLRSKIYQREAELELAAFVKHFKPTVFDPQMHGMNSGPFDQKKFRAGWQFGNQFTHDALFGDLGQEIPRQNDPKIVASDAMIERAWAWNYHVARLETAIRQSKIDYDASLVKFALFEQRAAAIASVIWRRPVSIIIPAFCDWVLFPVELGQNWLRFLTPNSAKSLYKAIPLETLALLPCAKLDIWEQKEILMIRLDPSNATAREKIEELFEKAPSYGLDVDDLLLPGACLDLSMVSAAKAKIKNTELDMPVSGSKAFDLPNQINTN